MSLLLPSSPSIYRFTGTLIGPDDDGAKSRWDPTNVFRVNHNIRPGD